jgi:hypothetical protein
MLNKSNENKLNGKTNRLLKIIYESVVQETFDFVGIMLLLDKVKKRIPFRILNSILILKLSTWHRKQVMSRRLYLFNK